MNNQKSYKIVVSSKKMRNIRGASPAEVAKKVALKLLVKNIYNMYFSIIEIKTNKIIHYQSNKKELVRPYHKNGKLVKYRIVKIQDCQNTGLSLKRWENKLVGNIN